jgi:Fe-S cluster assembly protein SufB
MLEQSQLGVSPESYKYGFHDPDSSVFKTEKGISEATVRQISAHKNEPDWMLKKRLKALKIFQEKPMPNWGPNLAAIDFANIYYYVKPVEQQQSDWAAVPANIRNTFDRLGIPEAEQKFLSGVGAQYDSEVVYHHLQDQLTRQGVIFVDPETAVRDYPDLVREYFGTIIPPTDHKFAALNTAFWSGGSFIYVPKGVRVDIPLQAYFRINTKNMGQFERTLIIADEGSFVHYIEGCTAPTYSSDSLHSAIVEIIAKKGARVRYSTIQNWSGNVYNLVTKRAVAHEAATVEWVDGNIGSKITMKYPSVYLMGRAAHAEILSIAFAGRGQIQDTGGKVIHVADDTTSLITSKSISKDGGQGSYRGLVKVHEGVKRARSNVVCDALILDEHSRSDTYPYMEIASDSVSIEHEARVSKISQDQLFYLMSRGMDERTAAMMIVNGFLDPLVKQLPMEYAVELNRLIELEMEGSVG